MEVISELELGVGQSWDADHTRRPDLEERSLIDFTSEPVPVAWESTNPVVHRPKDELLAWLTKQQKWRFDHGIPELASSSSLYSAYSLRTSTMLAMVDEALKTVAVDVSDAAFLDLGAAEGYVGNHLYDLGARDVDSCELNELNIQRTWYVRAFTGREFGRVGSIDLDNVSWSSSLGRTYDVALALGIIYHMENPLLFCRNLIEVAPIAVIESDTPNFPDNDRFRGFGNIYMHQDQVTLSPGRVRRLCELRPDRQALAEMLINAGYAHVHTITVTGSSASKYFVSGEKSLLVATR